MRIEHGYLPANRWLERPLDERWRRWLTWCVCGGLVVGVSMAAFVGPRQAVMRMRYEIAQLTQVVDRLEREQRRLVLEREALTSPDALAREASGLGLEVAPRERVAHLMPDGRLLFAPVKSTPVPATAANRKAQVTGGGKASERPASPARARGARRAGAPAGWAERRAAPRSQLWAEGLSPDPPRSYGSSPYQ